MANVGWILAGAFLVMFIQAGFALLETGLGRAKNAAHTMSLNLVVYCLSIVGFFICGFALMMGGADSSGLASGEGLGNSAILSRMLHLGSWGILGKRGFFLGGGSPEAPAILAFVAMVVYISTATTIPTGALTERWRFKSFFIFSLILAAVIYPVYGCWMWGGGWLWQLGPLGGLAHGAVDFAGGSVVHLAGGTIALVTVLLMGPRIGKYDEAGNPRPIFGHHMPMVILGTFILAFGWFGFNVGASLAGPTWSVPLVVANTMLSSSAAALTACLYMWLRYGKPDPSMICSGMLAGLVAITAGSAFVAPWAALLIGTLAGLLGSFSIMFLERNGIDDPVGVVSVHGINGLWGMLAVGLFADGTYGMGLHNVHLAAQGAGGINGWSHITTMTAGVPLPAGFREIGVTGLFYGNQRQFLAQAIAAIVCVAWNFCAAGALFWALGRFLGSNRVRPEVEIAGLDIPEMGAPGYPEFISAVAPENIPASEVNDAKAQIPAVADAANK